MTIKSLSFEKLRVHRWSLSIPYFVGDERRLASFLRWASRDLDQNIDTILILFWCAVGSYVVCLSIVYKYAKMCCFTSRSDTVGIFFSYLSY